MRFSFIDHDGESWDENGNHTTWIKYADGTYYETTYDSFGRVIKEITIYPNGYRECEQYSPE